MIKEQKNGMMNKRQVESGLEHDRYDELSHKAPPIMVQSANVSNTALMLENNKNFNLDSSEGDRLTQMPRVQGQGGGNQAETPHNEESKRKNSGAGSLRPNIGIKRNRDVP